MSAAINVSSAVSCSVLFTVVFARAARTLRRNRADLAVERCELEPHHALDHHAFFRASRHRLVRVRRRRVPYRRDQTIDHAWRPG